MTTEEQRKSIYDDSIDSFSDIIIFTKKGIPNLSIDFDGRTQANGKINFGICRTKRTKALIHWVQDFYCISGDPNIVDMNGVMFIENLDTNMYRAEIRNKLIDQSNTNAKEASPGTLESEKKWK